MTAQALRTIFDEAPELYAAARPGYPAELIADLARLASIGQIGRASCRERV